MKRKVLGLIFDASGREFKFVEPYDRNRQLTEDRWVGNLAKVFRKSQLHVLSNRTLPIDDDIAYPWSLQHLMGSKEMIKGLPLDMADDWWDLYRRAAEEVNHGASMRMAMVSMVGRKDREDGQRSYFGACINSVGVCLMSLFSSQWVEPSKQVSM